MTPTQGQQGQRGAGDALSLQVCSRQRPATVGWICRMHRINIHLAGGTGLLSAVLGEAGALEQIISGKVSVPQ